jgi:hypothetical protein
MIEEALSFARAVETWIYVFLGILGLFFVRRFIQAWSELRGAVFGLERESAQGRLNQAASALVLLLSLAVIEFVLVSFIAPQFPGASPLPTATLNLLATPTTTLPPGVEAPAGEQNVLEGPSGPTPLPGCVPGQIELLSPENGEEISGSVTVIGTANIPDFGFYKFEIKRPDDTIWLTIQAGSVAIIAGQLGVWDTSRLTPGEYQLSLVVVDNQAQAAPACIIRVRVAPTEQ